MHRLIFVKERHIVMLYYNTVLGEAFGEFTEKKSKFIGYIRHVETENEASEFISKIKSKHWDATHNVPAYILKNGIVRRFSDDKEPQGTAGLPALNVLEKQELLDVCVVVTRYFGGVLLGAGGLVRAYSKAVSCAIKNSEIVKMGLCKSIRLTCDYTHFNKIEKLAVLHNGIIDKKEFTEKANILMHVPVEFEEFIVKEINEIGSGSIEFEVMNESYQKLPDFKK